MRSGATLLRTGVSRSGRPAVMAKPRRLGTITLPPPQGAASGSASGSGVLFSGSIVGSKGPRGLVSSALPPPSTGNGHGLWTLPRPPSGSWGIHPFDPYNPAPNPTPVDDPDSGGTTPPSGGTTPPAGGGDDPDSPPSGGGGGGATPPPVCGVNWDTATAEMNAVIDDLRSCRNPNAPLPAYVECPSGSTGSGTGSEPSYRAARARYFEAKEQAGVACPSSGYGQPYGPAYGGSGGSYYDPSTYYQPQYGAPAQPAADTPMIAPETAPLMGRRAKMGLGIGGVVLLAGGLWAMLGRKRSKHRA